jgi:tetratricopeptide (TPR) repeat protein
MKMSPAASSDAPPASDSGGRFPARDLHSPDSGAGPLKISLQDLVRRYPKSCAFLALAVLGLIAYANALGNTFHFDDYEGIVRNVSLRSLKNVPAFFTDPTIFRFTRRLDWRPILQTSYALDYAIGGYNPFVFNVTDLSFHIGAAWLLFLTAREIGRRSPAAFALAPAVSDFSIALGAAALFVVHTVNSQTVNYVWARSSLLAALFYLLSFYCHVRGPFGGKAEKHLPWHLGALAAFACGLGSKATAVSLPAMLVAYEFLLLNPAGRNPLSLYLKEPRRLVKYLPTLAVLAGYIALRAALMPRSTHNLISTSLIGRSSYLLTQFRAWIYYLKLYLWPHPLVFDYPGFGWSTSLWDSRVLMSLAFIAAIAVGAWRVRRSRPMLSFFTLWFFIALLPEASVIVRPDAVTGHRPYLAYAGLSVAAILFGLQLAAWLWRRRNGGGRPPAQFRLACGLALGVALVLLTGATIRRNLDWRDEVTLWSDVIRNDPTNTRAHMSLGIQYVEREDYAKAQELLDRAVQLSPRNPDAYMYRGNLNFILGRYEQALSDLDIAVDRRRPSLFPFFYRGEVYRKIGRYDEALKDYESALRLDNRFPESYYGIAMVRWARKELPEATEACKKLLEFEPDERRSYVCLGSLLMHQALFGEAMKIYSDGVVRFAEDSDLWYGLGTAYEELGRYKDAEGAYARSGSLAREPERKAPSIK